VGGGTRNSGVRIAVDIGGTFTDIVLARDDGRLHQSKVSTTQADPARAVIEGVRDLLARLQISPGDVLEVLHGTTVGSNTILQKRGSPTALLTTKGFRDVLEIGRIRMPVMFDLTWAKPAPLVPRRRRYEIAERIGADGAVVAPLDEGEVSASVETMLEAGVEAVAICFINSYKNPEHEARAEEIVRRAAPGLAVCSSHTILPEMKEYERTSTTVVNAYLLRTMRSYLSRLEAALKSIGIPGPLLVMTSNGGMLPAQAAAEKPVFVVASGPAGGVIGAARLGEACGLRDLIVFDMGGTTAKAVLIESGSPTMTSEYEFREGMSTSSRFIKAGGYMLKVPAIDIAEVGAGGGSLAAIDKGGLLRVGPESAGADPGPVCYDRGNTQPTVTDANVALGYLNPSALAGGQLEIRQELIAPTLDQHVARPLGISVIEAAHGIRSVANALMARAIRAVTVERGRDPRDLALVAIGGNGGGHAVDIARQLGIRHVLVPALSGVFSAVGMLAADVEHTLVTTMLVPLGQLEPAKLEAAMAGLRQVGEDRLATDGYAPERRHFVWSAELRYEGQASELPVAFEEPRPDRLGRDFAAAYRALYGYDDDSEIELVRLRLVARGLRDKRLDFGDVRFEELPSAMHEDSRAVAAQRSHAPVSMPVIARAALRETPRPGPFIVEEFDATIVVPAGARARRDAAGTVHIEVGASDEG
jgi:N-methylhydantoinase A